MIPEFGWIAAGLCFLWNPAVNVIDALPDVFGWLFLAVGMTRLSYMREDIAHARTRAWILCGISAVKLLPMVFSVGGASRYPLAAEPTMVLTYTGCFALAEIGLGLSVLLPLLAAVSEIGLLGDSRAAIRGTGGLRFLTVWFFLLRAAGSLAPELVYLRSTEYLGNIVYGVVIDIRQYRPYLIVLCAGCVLVCGAGWLAVMLRYFRSIRREPAFVRAYEAAADAHTQEIVCRGTLERFAVSFAVIFLGGVFFSGLTLETVRVLPDAVGVFLTLGGLALLSRYRKPEKRLVYTGIGVGVVSAAYWGYSVWHAKNNRVFWADNIFDYFRRDIAVSPEKQAYEMRMQLLLLALSAAVTVLLILYFRQLLAGIRALDEITLADGVTLYDSMTADRGRAEREAYRKQPRTVFLWFCISAGMETIGNLPVFAFVITPFFLVRLLLNAAFLWRLYRLLSEKYRVIACHYRYNAE